MIRAVVSLARHRLAGRPAATLLLVAAVAAAAGLTGTIRVLGTTAADAAVARELAALDPADRAIRVSGYAPSGGDAVQLGAIGRAAAAATSSFTESATAGVIFRRVRDAGVPYDIQLVAIDGLAGSIDLADGRVPSPCDGRSCEAVLLSQAPTPTDLPAILHVDGLEIRITGRATLSSSIPLGHLDERGPELPPADFTAQNTDPAPAILIADGVLDVATAAGAAAIGRTYLWTAPLVTSHVHPWTVPAFEATLDAARRDLAATAPNLSLSAPSETIRAQLVLAAANDGRLILVGSLGVAILLAFVGYAALLGRRDLRAELDRLAAAGAGRAAAALLVGLETLIPTVIGVGAGWALAAIVWARLPGAEGVDVPGVVATALSGGPGVAIAMAVLGLSATAILLGLLAGMPRGLVAGLLPGGLGIAALVAWRLAADGGIDVADLGADVDVPVLALLPAVVGLAVAAAAIVLVPWLLRVVAATGNALSTPVRLALLSLARDPVRPAATITLLAFGIGGLVFAITDAATLRRGIADQAAFTVGMDLRVTEAATGLILSNSVAPIGRYAVLGDDVATIPVAHVAGSAEPAGELTVLGLPPDAFGDLVGWRSDLGADAAALGSAIAVEGDFTVPGVTLDPDATKVAVTVSHRGDPVYLSVVVAATDGEAARLFLGTLKPGRERMEAPLPPALAGGRIIGVIVSEGRLVAGALHPGVLARATLTFEGLDAVTGAGPVEVEVSGTQSAILRAPLPTDDLVLPAIVGPAIAARAAATPDGTLLVTLGDRPLVRIRVAGVVSRFPGIPGAGEAFAVVDLDPMLAAMDGAAPGSGYPDEAWIKVADAARLAAVEMALTEAPFRDAVVRSRPGIAAAAAADPFAGSILAAFTAAGLTGLLLAALGLALGALADLRDETGELRDLEAQGLGPRALRRQIRARTLILAGAGAVGGGLTGLGLAAVVTATVGIGAGVSRPVPPLILEVPWDGLLVAIATPIVAASLVAALAAARAFRSTARTGDRR